MKYTSPTLGFEATYRLSSQLAILQDITDKEDDAILNSIGCSNHLYCKTKAAKIVLFNTCDSDVDDRNLEVRTEIIKPNQRKKMYAEFNKLNKLMAKYFLVPSTISHNPNMEGGGHIHMGYPEGVEYQSNMPNIFLSNMLKNLNDIANNFPALIWAMNSPYDNINAKSSLNNPNFKRGVQALSDGFRHCETYGITSKQFSIIPRLNYETFEFRFFTMPKDGEGLKFNVAVAESMYKKAFDMSVSNTSLDPKYKSKFALCSISKNQALYNLKMSAEYLGLDYSDFVKHDRVKSLRKRFQLEATFNPDGDIDNTYLT